MSNQLNVVWQKIVELLKNEMTELSYNTWIKTIEPISLKSNVLELGVLTEFIKGILESRYSELVRNAVRQVTAKNLEIRFTITSADGLPNQTEKQPYVSILHPKYTFDTFVIGSGNRFAHAAALAVAEAPAKAYNPFFIYGGVGLGKTHLMHAIGHYIINRNPSQKVLYVSSEQFTNELINAIKDDKNEEFRYKYRSIDVLLIDDIQFIGGKERTQEEFFHTFNSLYEATKQIVVSCDKPPKDILTLEERLRSRFEWGLIADIQPPDVETRMAILRKKSQQESFEVPDEVMYYIADKIASNIRELEGALIKLIAYSSLTRNDISLEMAAEVLKDILSESSTRKIDSAMVVEAVARYFDIFPGEFNKKKRSRDISYPRQIAMFLCRELTDLSLPKIGDVFGGRDHSTVLHGINKIEHEVTSNLETRRAVEELKRNITGK